ncbi:MAG: hypothetical protein ACLFV5_05980 [Anaerolineales bacterium]
MEPGVRQEPFTFDDGSVELPQKPGLGIELDEEAMEDRIGHDWQNPERYDPHDDTPLNW